MPRPRYDNIDPDKKARLLTAAIQEFGTHGYELASINRILDAAGLSKSSFYYYFDDKADLAATVMLHAAEPVMHLGTVHMPRTVDEFWAELRRTSMERLKLLESKRAEYQCIVRLSNAFATEPTLAEKVLPRFEPGRREMVAFLQKGVELGALRRDLPLQLLIGLIEAAKLTAYKTQFPGDRVPSDAEMETFSDLVLDLAQRIAAPSKG